MARTNNHREAATSRSYAGYFNSQPRGKSSPRKPKAKTAAKTGRKNPARIQRTGHTKPISPSLEPSEYGTSDERGEITPTQEISSYPAHVPSARRTGHIRPAPPLELSEKSSEEEEEEEEEVEEVAPKEEVSAYPASVPSARRTGHLLYARPRPCPDALAEEDARRKRKRKRRVTRAKQAVQVKQTVVSLLDIDRTISSFGALQVQDGPRTFKFDGLRESYSDDSDDERQKEIADNARLKMVVDVDKDRDKSSEEIWNDTQLDEVLRRYENQALLTRSSEAEEQGFKVPPLYPPFGGIESLKMQLRSYLTRPQGRIEFPLDLVEKLVERAERQWYSGNKQKLWCPPNPLYTPRSEQAHYLFSNAPPSLPAKGERRKAKYWAVYSKFDKQDYGSCRPKEVFSLSSRARSVSPSPAPRPKRRRALPLELLASLPEPPSEFEPPRSKQERSYHRRDCPASPSPISRPRRERLHRRRDRSASPSPIRNRSFRRCDRSPNPSPSPERARSYRRRDRSPSLPRPRRDDSRNHRYSDRHDQGEEPRTPQKQSSPDRYSLGVPGPLTPLSQLSSDGDLNRSSRCPTPQSPLSPPAGNIPRTPPPGNQGPPKGWSELSVQKPAFHVGDTADIYDDDDDLLGFYDDLNADLVSAGVITNPVVIPIPSIYPWDNYNYDLRDFYNLLGYPSDQEMEDDVTGIGTALNPVAVPVGFEDSYDSDGMEPEPTGAGTTIDPVATPATTQNFNGSCPTFNQTPVPAENCLSLTTAQPVFNLTPIPVNTIDNCSTFTSVPTGNGLSLTVAAQPTFNLTSAASISDPFKAQTVTESGPISNPFNSISVSQTMQSGPSVSPFSATPVTSEEIVNPFLMNKEGQPLNNRIMDKSAQRQARFEDNTDIATVYNEAREAREKERERLIKDGVIDDPNLRKSLDEAIKFVGTCTTMCPEYESIERTYQKMVDVLEQHTGNFVKSFHRPAAGIDPPLPSDVRTPEVLVESLRYLVRELIGKFEWHECHNFVRDRTRGIRQDLVYQNYSGTEAVVCNEIIARFHILALKEMLNNPDHGEFMELEQLDKCLTSLQYFYKDGLKPCDGYCAVFPNEPEFRSYMILRHLRDSYVLRDDSTKWNQEVQDSPAVKHALNLYSVIQRCDRTTDFGLNANNYVYTFFQLVKDPKTDYLTACLLQTYFADIRKFALKTLAEHYMKTSTKTTIEHIVEVLGYETQEQATEEMQYYGLELQESVVDGFRVTYLVNGKDQFLTDTPKPRTQNHPSIIDFKRSGSLPAIVWGNEHQNIPYKVSVVVDTKAFIDGDCQIEEYQFENDDDFFADLQSLGEENGFENSTVPSEPMLAFSRDDDRNTGPASVFAKATKSTFLAGDASSGFGGTPKSVFSTNTSNTTSVFAKTPALVFSTNGVTNSSGKPSVSIFAKTPESVFPANDTKQASVFSKAPASVFSAAGGKSIPNPFLPPEKPKETNFPTIPKKSDSLFDKITLPSSQLTKIPPANDESPLFLGDEDDTSDSEIPAAQVSWTDLLPSKSQSVNGSQSEQETVLPDNHNLSSSISVLPSTANNLVPTQEIPSNNANVELQPDGAAENQNKKLLAFVLSAAEIILQRNDEDGNILLDFLKELREQDEKNEVMVKISQDFYGRRLLAKIFYKYLDKTRRQLRRAAQELRKQRRRAYAEDPQWWPITKDESLFKHPVEVVSKIVFKPAELELSIPDVVHMALSESNISDTTYRMLLHNNDQGGKSEYWFQQKFLGPQEKIFALNSKLRNEFHAQFTISQEEAPTVGSLIFGCSTDFSQSNELRFQKDRSNLHFIVDYLTGHTIFSKLAIMVICYRSPIDDEPADPSGLDTNRTLGKARRDRIELVKEALGFERFDDNVIGRKVVMVETLRDLDLSHELRAFADNYILETINPHYSDGSLSSSKEKQKSRINNTLLETSDPSELSSPSETKRRSEETLRQGKRKRTGQPSPRTPVSLDKAEYTMSLSSGKRKRVGEPSPRTPMSLEKSEYIASTLSSGKRRRNDDPASQNTPLKRYCQKTLEKERLDGARMRAKSLIGIQVLYSAQMLPTTTQPRVPPAPPKVDTNQRDRVNSLANKMIETQKSTASLQKWMDEQMLQHSP